MSFLKVWSVKLVDICKIQYGYPFDSSLFTDDSTKMPLIRIRDIVPGKTLTYYSGEYPPEYIIHKGDILVGMDGEFNLAKWGSEDALLNQRVCKISSKDEKIVLNRYLFHILKPLFKRIEADIQGSTVKHLSAKLINKITIQIPTVEKQHELAD